MDRPAGFRDAFSERPATLTETAKDGSAQFVRPPAVHPHALDVFHTNQLYADVVASIFVAGETNQRSPGFIEVVKLAGQNRDLFGGYRAVQAIAGEQQNVARQQLTLVQVHVDE